jgi:transcriptional repressor NrdR
MMPLLVVECPYCGSDSRVLDSRGVANQVRRRRQCLSCERRFTTYERLADPDIRVLKRDGETEAFDREKLLRVVERVTRGRPATDKDRHDLVRGLEAELVDAGGTVVTSGQIADRVLLRLRELDPLAAARFAGNYLDDAGRIVTRAVEAKAQLPLPLETPAPPNRRGKRKG